MTNEELDAIEARANAATAGPSMSDPADALHYQRTVLTEDIPRLVAEVRRLKTQPGQRSYTKLTRIGSNAIDLSFIADWLEANDAPAYQGRAVRITIELAPQASPTSPPADPCPEGIPRLVAEVRSLRQLLYRGLHEDPVIRPRDDFWNAVRLLLNPDACPACGEPIAEFEGRRVCECGWDEEAKG